MVRLLPSDQRIIVYDRSFSTFIHLGAVYINVFHHILVSGKRLLYGYFHSRSASVVTFPCTGLTLSLPLPALFAHSVPYAPQAAPRGAPEGENDRSE